MMKSGKTWFGITTLATVLAASLFAGTASAAIPRQGQNPTGTDTRPHPVRIVGRVQSVNANGLVLTMPRGSVNVQADNRTWILVERDGVCTEGTLSDIQTNMPAAVAGMTTTVTNTVNARVIAQARCGRLAEKGLAAKGKLPSIGEGTIKSINGSTLTVTTAKGQDLTVNTTADTLVFDNGFKSVSALKAGEKVQALVQPDKSQAAKPKDKPATAPATPRTVTAWALRVVHDNTQMVIGKVDTVNGNTITLKTPKNPAGITITLDGSTGYKTVSRANGKVTISSGSQATVQAGSRLIVEGTTSADGKSMTAKAVVVLTGKANK